MAQRAAWTGVLACVVWTWTAAPSHGQTSSPLMEQTEGRRSGVQGALADSLRLLTMEHVVRIAAQPKTRRELGGPFWSDYRNSLRVPRTWSDGDGWLVNYVGHPIHGAAAGFIWERHDPASPGAGAGFTGDYWRSRLRATAWSAGYSAQFELGLFSEAAIGNVGKDPRTVGWVDHVVTPIGGLAMMVAEDAVDRYLVERLEGRVRNRVARAVVRVALNPSRTLSNLAGARAPWHRDARPITARRQGWNTTGQ